MAPSPTIPTSFVPKQPVKTVTRRPQSGTNVFTLFGFMLLMFSIVLAGGVFGYKTYLQSVKEADAVKLDAAKKEISQSTVEDFIRTRDRFTAASVILDDHIAFSQFLKTMEGLTLQNIRFSNLRYSIGIDGSATVQMTGAARSFNALAAESAKFTGEKQLQHAIFSGIGVNDKDSTVTFQLSAQVDKTLIQSAIPQRASDIVAPVTIGTTTATTTPTQTPKNAKAATTTP